ncbi:MAG TPA: TlpA disulfide reductase family protein, partial [Bdellovibrionales bacterium]|nr:TlpA disulfide reductase family protein [Bdellovibrionales bacterium]
MSDESPERSQFPNWFKITLVVVVAVLIGSAYLAQRFGLGLSAPEKMEAAAVESREAVPDFILTDADGKQKHLSEYHGDVVILSFWASWCGPCLVELPTFAEIEKQYGDRGLRVVPVNVEEGKVGLEFAKGFWAKNGFKFP